jgi:hypothetical protein
VNVAHASALNVSITPPRSVVSLTRVTPLSLAASTQFPPLAPLNDDFRQFIPRLPWEVRKVGGIAQWDNGFRMMDDLEARYPQ